MKGIGEESSKLLAGASVLRGRTRKPKTRTLKEAQDPPSVAAAGGHARPHTCVRTGISAELLKAAATEGGS